MKRFRLPVLVAGALVVLVGIALAVVFSSAFQTWATRQAIASRPGIRASIGEVSAGIKRIELKDLQYVHAGAVLNLPKVEVDLPLIAAAWDDDVRISRLVAKGWTLDLSKTKAAPASSLAAAPTAPNTRKAAATPPAPANGRSGAGTPVNEPAPTSVSAPATVPAPAAASGSASAATEAFTGIFSQIKIPVDLSVDGVQLEGEVILPESRGRVKVTLSGGGLRAGREGEFNWTADAALTQSAVRTIQLRGTVDAAMDTPRSFSRVAMTVDAAAQGEKFPQGVKLRADVAASRVEAGESYSASVVTEGQEVLAIKAALPRAAQAFTGTWKLNVRDADVAPFAFGQPLPVFAAAGEGVFKGDGQFEAIHANGRLAATLSRLETMLPALSNVGELKVTTEFDLAEHAGTFVVQKFAATVDGAQPIATLRALQPFEFNPGSGELRTPDAQRELVGLALHAVPVAWAAPLLKDLDVAGGALRGELTVTARDGGMTVRSTSPLTIDGIAVTREGKPLVQKLDLALNASADYTLKGWQAEVSGFTVTSGEETLLALDAKAGQLAGSGQALKATGTLTAGMRPLFAQPAAAGTLRLTSGDARVAFVLSLDAKDEIQANVTLENLGTVVDTKAVKMPAISTNLRADIGADGKISFNAPLQIVQGERKSDLTVIGSIGPEKEKLRAIDAEVTSTQLVLEDAQLFAALFPEQAADAGSGPKSPRASAPPWAGLHGSLALQLKRIIYSDAIQVSNVTGRLRIDAGVLKLEALQAGLGGSGRADLSGAVTFNAGGPKPYALAMDVAVREFDPAPLFRAITGSGTATVEGKFDVSSKLAGRAATIAELASGAGGQFQLTSKGGVFRGLPVDVSNIVENTSKLAAWIATAGTAITAIAGKKDYADVASRAEAVAELARGLNPIPYDQLSVSVSRDAALNTTLRNFTLISPELRLTGSGTALHKPGSCLLEDSLAMEFTLRARGRQGELLKYLGALEPQTDDLGYATCTVPLKVAGTLGKPDTSEVNTKLTALAIEKSGFGDKAAEFLSKIRGGK